MRTLGWSWIWILVLATGCGGSSDPMGNNHHTDAAMNGLCAPACAADKLCCGTICVDSQSDTLNCGGCGNVCPLGAAGRANLCTAGVCRCAGGPVCAEAQ